jgi:hypothetical protein
MFVYGCDWWWWDLQKHFQGVFHVHIQTGVTLPGQLVGGNNNIQISDHWIILAQKPSIVLNNEAK